MPPLARPILTKGKLHGSCCANRKPFSFYCFMQVFQGKMSFKVGADDSENHWPGGVTPFNGHANESLIELWRDVSVAPLTTNEDISGEHSCSLILRGILPRDHLWDKSGCKLTKWIKALVLIELKRHVDNVITKKQHQQQKMDFINY